MIRFENFLNGAVLTVLMGIAVFVGALFTTEVQRLEWETLAAGFAGLLGGWLAFIGARSQYIAETQSQALAFKLEHYDTVTKAREEVVFLDDVKSEDEDFFIERCRDSKSTFHKLAISLSSCKSQPAKMFTISSSLAQKINDWKSTVDRYMPVEAYEDSYGRIPTSFQDISKALDELSHSLGALEEYLEKLGGLHVS